MRLYEVSRTITVYVMAEDPGDAHRVGLSAIKDEQDNEHEIEAPVEVTHRDWPVDAAWDYESLVYGTDEDTTLKSVLETLPKRPARRP